MWIIPVFCNNNLKYAVWQEKKLPIIFAVIQKKRTFAHAIKERLLSSTE